MYGLTPLVRYEPRRAQARRGRKGFVAIALAVSAVFLLGMAGLAVDLGRMYVFQDEAQTFTDAAALRAALQIDGSTTGVTRAVSAAGATPKKYQFGMQSFEDVTIQWGTTKNGPWVDTADLPAPPDEYLFIRVAARVHAPLTLLRAVTSDTQSTITAAAVAGREEKTKFDDSLFPSSPYSHKGCGDVRVDGTKCADPDDPFGFTVGRQYTLRWPGPSNKNFCDGDDYPTIIGMSDVAPVEFRGFIELSSSSSLRDSILYDVGPYPQPIELGTELQLPGGDKNTQTDAMGQRYNQDTDTTSSTYAEYKALGLGNGRRVVLVPVNSGPVKVGETEPFTVVGFAAFFLNLPSEVYGSIAGNKPACAEYIGSVTAGGPFSGGSDVPAGSDSGVLQLRLFQ